MICSPRPYRPLKIIKTARFQVRYKKVGNSGVIHKTKIEDALQKLNFGFFHLFNTKQTQRGYEDIKIDSFFLIFPQVEKSKVKIGVLFIVGILSKINFLEHFVSFNFLIGHSPEALQAHQHP